MLNSLPPYGRIRQSTAAGAEESAAAAQQLNVQSQSLKDVVGLLTDMVGGDAASSGR
jgi:methyl-accepting chemotaxis protein/methyl-accepting chemotaxis protein-1 (serine sensor receptor)